MLQSYHRHCAETFRLSYVFAVARTHSLERSNLFRIFFSTNTFATHEASCNESRFNFRKYYRIFAIKRKEGRPQRGRWNKKKKKKRYVYIGPRIMHRAFWPGLHSLSCAACHSSAFGVEKSRFIVTRLASAIFDGFLSQIIDVARIEASFFFFF